MLCAVLTGRDDVGRSVLVRVSGRVQGVGFRYFVVREARRLGVAGYAMNLSDGSVEIRAEGESIVVQHLIDAVRRGPKGSRVDDVEIESVEITDGEMSEFDVRY